MQKPNGRKRTHTYTQNIYQISNEGQWIEYKKRSDQEMDKKRKQHTWLTNTHTRTDERRKTSIVAQEMNAFPMCIYDSFSLTFL